MGKNNDNINVETFIFCWYNKDWINGNFPYKHNNKKRKLIMVSQSVLTIGPTGAAHRYSSMRAASRALSGYGDDGARSSIARRVRSGGGYLGSVWIEGSNIPTVHRTY